MSTISCSVGILTYNSGQTLRRALESVKEFQDIIVCDGGSTDDTIEIAEEYGARVILQDVKYKNPDGRLRDFSGPRNQMLSAATYDWFLFIDSDECVTEPLCREIEAVISKDVPGAYWVPRLYTLRGNIVWHASTYPNQQMRFFHTSVSEKFIKEVHERILLRDGVVPEWLTEHMLVPLPDSAAELKQKWKRYIAIEAARCPSITFKRWLRRATHEFLVGGLFLFRTIRNMILYPRTSLPLSYEFTRLWYQYALITALLSCINKSNFSTS